MNSVTPTRTGLRFELNWVTLCLLFVFFFTLLNGFYCSLRSEYDAPEPWQRTFLFYPQDEVDDLHADLLASGLSFPPYPALDTSTWPENCVRFYQHNHYQGLEGVEKHKITALGLPPLTIFLMLMVKQSIIHLGPQATTALFYAVVVLLVILTVRWFITDPIERSLALVTVIFSYPCLMILSRGNVGAAPTALLLIFFIALACGRRYPLLAALCLALACNFRPNAVLLTPLLFCYGFRRGIVTGLASGALTLAIAVPFFFADVALYPGYSFAVFRHALAIYNQAYLFDGLGDAYNNSLYAAMKMVYQLCNGHPTVASAIMTNLFATLLCGVLILYATVLYLRGKLPNDRFAYVLTALYVLGTTVMGSYHLFVFFAFILMAAKEGRKATPMLPFFAAIVLIPKNYVFIGGNLSYEILLNPLHLFLSLSLLLIGRDALRAEEPVSERETA
jgi:hypothetical protein